MAHIWNTDISDPFTPLQTLGKGFFFRAVCALEFSWDGQLLVAVGSDDYHTLGVFEIASGALLCQEGAQHGEEDQGLCDRV